MDHGVWVGFAIIVVWVGSAYVRIKSERRSGVTQSHGHPMLDSGLLLGSAFVLISVLVPLVSRSGNRRHGPHYFEDMVLLSIGIALTWICNGLLQRSKKGPGGSEITTID
jgi:hypothetical protein